MPRRSVRKRLLLPLGIAFLSIIVVAVGCIYWLQLTYIDRAVATRLAGVENLIPRVTDRDAEVLKTNLQYLAEVPELQRAWLDRDRQRLTLEADSHLQHLRSRFGVSHLYFIQPDRYCFLRAHNPGDHGDLVERFTLKEAARTQKAASGIELGRFEALTLRVVHPWYIDGELSGYLELGKEIAHLSQSLKTVLGVDLVFTLSKAQLSRQEWEQGRKLFNSSGSWDDFPAFVVIDHTFGRMEPTLAGLLQGPTSHDRQNLSFKSSDGREYRGQIAPLLDAGARRVGQMLVFHDITEETGHLEKALGLVTGFSILAAGFLFFFFNFYAGRIDRALGRSFEDLEREIGERRKTQAELQNYQNLLQELVSARTAELEKANLLLEQDIRRRQQIEVALRESEQKFRSLFEGASENILIIDPESLLILEANQTAAERLGYGGQKLKQVPLSNLLPPSQPELAGEDIRNTIERGNQVAQRVQVASDGREIPVEVSSQVIEYEGRKAVLSVAREITDRKRAEAEQQRAQKLESIGLLAGGIAHDFNNILTAILGNINLAALLLPPDSPALPKLAMAEKAVTRAESLAQQLLTFAKGGEPVRKTCSVPFLVEEQVTLALRGSRVRSEYSFQEHLWSVKVDEGQFSQVVSNLTINALQAMPEGGILRISAANELIESENTLGLDRGRYVRIEFEDEGCGIAHSHLAKIFDPYFTTKKTGSGLGLAISFSIIRKHGGAITARSAPGEGAAFLLYLPASQEAAEPPLEGGDEILPGSGRILMMDDDPDVNAAASGLLHSLGYQVATVTSGAQAVAAFREARKAGEPFDLVIADLTVPGGLGGEEMARQILSLDPEAKIIVSSGYAHNAIMADYARFGFRGVLPKPYKAGELSRTLHQVLIPPSKKN